MALAACGGCELGRRERWRRRQDADHLHRPAAAGGVEGRLGRDEQRDQAVPRADRQQGRRLHDRAQEVRRLDRRQGRVGRRDVREERARTHVANTDEVAVMGTYNSGCAKIEVPVLNQDPDGPMLMVSHANTNPGLTKTWDPGEPREVLPDGQAQLRPRRHHRRLPGSRRPRSSRPRTLGVKKCYVLNDNQTYGQGVAQAFEDEAKTQGIEVLGNEPWDAKQPNYTALLPEDQGHEPRLRLPRRHLRQQRWPARQGQGRRPR